MASCSSSSCDSRPRGSRASPAASGRGGCVLTLEEVTKRLGGLTAVRAVSLEVRAGDLLGIIGPNGAGKTTLFNVIAGYYRPEEGRVRLEGRDGPGLAAN